jgi:4-diphosphocytidyl-2-C-methyl-D-erythritol kinase
MITFPKAKINFGLRITEKRPDGYHDIETIFYPVDLADALECVMPKGKAEGDELVVTGIKVPSRTGDNLVLKALQRLRQDFSIPDRKSVV